MRILGGVAAFMICVLWGTNRAAVLAISQKIMSRFSRDIYTLADEMEYRPQDIRNIADKLSSGQLGGFWRVFAENIPTSASGEQAWKQAMKAYAEFSVLGARERMLIAEAGGAMGVPDLRGSVSALRHLGRRAEMYADELEKQRRSKGTMYQKLGLLCGLAVMLLIV